MEQKIPKHITIQLSAPKFVLILIFNQKSIFRHKNQIRLFFGNKEKLETVKTALKNQIPIQLLRPVKPLTIDTVDFKRMVALSNNDTTVDGQKSYPLAGALLPYNRIIAYYWNLYSTRMGI
jgi:hypothetical protein